MKKESVECAEHYCDIVHTLCIFINQDVPVELSWENICTYVYHIKRLIKTHCVCVCESIRIIIRNIPSVWELAIMHACMHACHSKAAPTMLWWRLLGGFLHRLLISPLSLSLTLMKSRLYLILQQPHMVRLAYRMYVRTYVYNIYALIWCVLLSIQTWHDVRRLDDRCSSIFFLVYVEERRKIRTRLISMEIRPIFCNTYHALFDILLFFYM